MIETKPFAGYASHADCVSKNKNKRDPDAYCAEIRRQVEGKSFVFYSEPIKWIETKSNDGSNYTIKGYISTGERDLIGDIVTQNCMKSMMNQIGSRTLKLDFEHETWVGESIEEKEAAKTKSPLGKAVMMDRDDTGVFITWDMNQDYKKFDSKGNIVKKFSEVKSEIENGFLDAFSIAFIPTKTKDVEVEGKKTRLLDDMTLLNVALTGNPICPGAKMVSIVAKSLAYMETLNTTSGGSFSSIDDKNLEETMSEEKKNVEAETKPEVKASDAEIKSLAERVEALEKKAEEEEAEPEKQPEPEPEKPESEKPAEPEQKASEDRFSKIEAELKELKATLESPQYKAAQEDMKSSMSKPEEKADKSGPLDMLG